MVVVDYILVEFRPLGERRRALAALALALEACSTFIYLTSDVFYTAYSTISPPHFTSLDIPVMAPTLSALPFSLAQPSAYYLSIVLPLGLSIYTKALLPSYILSTFVHAIRRTNIKQPPPYEHPSTPRQAIPVTNTLHIFVLAAKTQRKGGVRIRVPPGLECPVERVIQPERAHGCPTGYIVVKRDSATAGEQDIYGVHSVGGERAGGCTEARATHYTLTLHVLCIPINAI
ncbi:hypothetical protein C8J57DRAFT_1717321 [Mycena rebaudengoi]|nr:hypothetical protein C8J57DRAFT_1717321 [Mycena rebaudengoi]